MGVQGQGFLTLELFICMQVYRIQVIIFGGIYDMYNNIDLAIVLFTWMEHYEAGFVGRRRWKNEFSEFIDSSYVCRGVEYDLFMT